MKITNLLIINNHNEKNIKTKTGQFLDEMTFQHVKDKSIDIYYNLVKNF